MTLAIPPITPATGSDNPAAQYTVSNTNAGLWKITGAANKLLGLDGTGVWQEVTVGSGLAYSSATLSATGGTGSFPTTVNAISTTATAVSGQVNRCTATSANYTVTIPDGSANTDLLVIAITDVSTKLVTISGKLKQSTTNTRVMHNGESFTFRWNTTLGGWEVVDKVIIPMTAGLSRSTTSTGHGTVAWEHIDMTAQDYGDSLMFDSGNGRISIQRPGRYNVTAFAYLVDGTATNTSFNVCAAKNQTADHTNGFQQMFGVSGTGAGSFACAMDCVAGDYISYNTYAPLHAYDVRADLVPSRLTATEVPTW
jgi:hypothetical protein